MTSYGMNAEVINSTSLVTTTIINECLWKDGLHLNNDGTSMFASNFVDFLNDFIFNWTI